MGLEAEHNPGTLFCVEYSSVTFWLLSDVGVGSVELKESLDGCAGADFRTGCSTISSSVVFDAGVGSVELEELLDGCVEAELGTCCSTISSSVVFDAGVGSVELKESLDGCVESELRTCCSTSSSVVFDAGNPGNGRFQTLTVTPIHTWSAVSEGPSVQVEASKVSGPACPGRAQERASVSVRDPQSELRLANYPLSLTRLIPCALQASGITSVSVMGEFPTTRLGSTLAAGLVTTVLRCARQVRGISKGVGRDHYVTGTHCTERLNKARQMLVILGPQLNRHSALSTRNGLTLYKQLLRPILDYTCPAWGHLADTYMRSI
uniref:Uncharacterized protein n=1 Tax=Timema bartmani TaxID=61472 RepID=A0A7R9F891_9NEOP|nr:unnamed protein product [Timema bartmani]